MNALPVVIVAFVAVLLMLRAPSRVDPAEFAVALVLLALTISAYRFVLFWAIAMVPVIARAYAEAERRPRAAAPRWLVPGSILAVAIGLPLLVPTHFARTLPLAAVERLRQEHVRGTVYADFPFGGVVLDAGYPDWHVAYDGRYYRYSQDEWRYNGGIENGFVPLVDIERKWHPAAFILDAAHNAPIAGELARRRDWRRIWAREGIVVYVPRGR